MPYPSANFFNPQSTSFSSLPTHSSLVKGIFFRQYTSFPRGFCNSTKYTSNDIVSIFGSKHLSFQILSDLSCLVLQNPAYRSILRRLGFDVPEEAERDSPNAELDNYLRGQVARILLTPNAEISQVIRKNLRQMEGFKHVVGAQLRTGGGLAITRENGKFLWITTLSKVGPLLREEIKKRGWREEETALMLSADSGVAYMRVKSSLYEVMKVFTGVGYRAGHSSSYLAHKHHFEYLKRAILDLVLLSQSEFLVITYGSSYGTLAMRLSLHNQAFILTNY